MSQATAQTKQVYLFKEDNDHEGEVWRFYIPMTQEEYQHLVKLIDGDTFSYSVTTSQESFRDIKRRIIDAENEYGGYAPPYQIATLCPDFMSLDDPDKLYKFQFLRTLSACHYDNWKKYAKGK